MAVVNVVDEARGTVMGMLQSHPGRVTAVVLGTILAVGAVIFGDTDTHGLAGLLGGVFLIALGAVGVPLIQAWRRPAPVVVVDHVPPQTQLEAIRCVLDGLKDETEPEVSMMISGAEKCVCEALARSGAATRKAS